MSPALGPRRVLCVVVVTTSQWSKGLGITCDECVIVIYVCDCVSALCECVHGNNHTHSGRTDHIHCVVYVWHILLHTLQVSALYLPPVHFPAGVHRSIRAVDRRQQRSKSPTCAHAANEWGHPSTSLSTATKYSDSWNGCFIALK